MMIVPQQYQALIARVEADYDARHGYESSSPHWALETTFRYALEHAEAVLERRLLLLGAFYLRDRTVSGLLDECRAVVPATVWTVWTSFTSDPEPQGPDYALRTRAFAWAHALPVNDNGGKTRGGYPLVVPPVHERAIRAFAARHHISDEHALCCVLALGVTEALTTIARQERELS